jgi:photosystem II stability/assembly factor-like uncharacterized protein
MNKIVFLSIFIPSTLFSQWVQQNVPSDLDMILSIDFANVNTGVACGWKENFTGKAAYTTNSGLNWIIAQFPDSSRSLVVVQMINDNTGYIAGAYNIFKDNLIKPAPVMLNKNFRSWNYHERIGMTGSPADPDEGYKGLFLKTTNGGRTWFTYGVLPSNVYYLMGMKFINFNTGFVSASLEYYAGGKNGVLKTTNGGLSWNILYSIDTSDINNVFTPDGNNVFVTGWKRFGYNTFDGIILRSSNGGSSWTIQRFSDCGAFYDVYFPNASTGFALTDDTDITALIYKTTNYGVNWTRLPFQSPMAVYNKIEFVNGSGKGIAIGNIVSPQSQFDKLLISRTTNYGSNWTSFMIPDTEHILYSSSLIDANNWFIAGGTYNDGIIYKSTNGGAIGIQPISSEIPNQFSLYQNFPNPFNPTTKIKFQIAKSGDVKLVIFDVLGREAATLVNENLNPGTYEVTWDAGRYPSGVYFYRLITQDYSETKKMVFLK